MIALVTCYFHHNYGSMLQAYATQNILQNWGIPCEHICIDGLIKEIKGSKVKFYMTQINNPQVLTGTILRVVKKRLYQKIKKNTLAKDLEIRKQYFDQFIRQHFVISTKYGSKDELSKTCDKYTYVIVGSDQLWLPSNIEADYYTLNWVPSNVPKVAFATSFGTSFLPPNIQKKANQFLHRFSHISVREESGQRMIHEYANMDVPVVCDPTLLFSANDWMCIQKKDRMIKEKYILCYFLGNNTKDREFAKKLRDKTGFKLVALLHLDEFIKKDEDYADMTPYDIGPGEWINLIRYAEYIVTDSFHGSVFSIIYKKVFFTSRRVQKDGLLCTNNRLDSLFSQLGISGRFIDGEQDVEEYLNRQIDYTTVDVKLKLLTDQSKIYLSNALGYESEMAI
jgi:hypothetical protein